jgi:DUF1365 family protein
MLHLVLESLPHSLLAAALVAGLLLLAFLSLTLLNVIPNSTKTFDGTVLHSRRKNGGALKSHKFEYNISMDLLDLDDPPSKKCAWFPAFVSFHRSAYIRGSPCLKRTVLSRIHQPASECHNFKVYLLTNLAVLGRTFNPISVYYVFHHGALRNIIAEVTNIPWLEKTTYVLDIDGNNHISNSIHEKKLHVSPFNPHSNQLYEFAFSVSGGGGGGGGGAHAAALQSLFFSIQVHDTAACRSSAVMTVCYSLAAARFRLLRPPRPLLTVTRIHWQALKLWAKRFVVYDHPLRTSATSEDAKRYTRNTE